MYKVDFFKNEIALIRNPPLRTLVSLALEAAPEYFWSAPASSTGKHHPLDSNGVGGLVRHTCKVVWFAVKFCDAHNLQSDISIVAALLHDYTKFGFGPEMETGKNRPFYENHASICADHLMETFAISDELTEEWRAICQCIRTHMGRWGPEPPVTAQQWIVHLADMAASEKHFIAVKFQDDKPQSLDTQDDISLPPVQASQGKIIEIDDNLVVNFGKYRGQEKTVEWVVENDRSYVNWILGPHDKPFDDIVIDAFNDALETLRDNGGLFDSAADRKSEEFWDAF